MVKMYEKMLSELIILCGTNSISNNTCILSVSWESAAVFSTNTGQSKDNLLVLWWSLTLNTVLIPSAANVMAAWQRGLCFHSPHLSQRQINDFYLSSAAKEEVIDTIHKWCQGFVSEAYEWQKHPPPPPKKHLLFWPGRLRAQTHYWFFPHTFF